MNLNNLELLIYMQIVIYYFQFVNKNNNDKVTYFQFYALVKSVTYTKFIYSLFILNNKPILIRIKIKIKK